MVGCGGRRRPPTASFVGGCVGMMGPASLGPFADTAAGGVAVAAAVACEGEGCGGARG